MNEFLHQGGYAFFVWSAYGVTALALLLEVLALRAGWRQTLRRLMRLRRRERGET